MSVLAHTVLAAVADIGWPHEYLLGVTPGLGVRLRLQSENLRTGETVGSDRLFLETWSTWQVQQGVRRMVREIEEAAR